MPRLKTSLWFSPAKTQFTWRLALLCLCLLFSGKAFSQSCGGNCDNCCCGGCTDVTGAPSGACPKGCCSSPIIVDTTGHGFHLTSAEDGVWFDIHADGHPVLISWTATGSGNAFLALDRNHNGRIDDGKELFGNITAQPKSDWIRVKARFGTHVVLV